MRALLVLIGLAALVLVGLLALGLVRLDGTAGTLPTVKVEGGSAPQVTANVATLDVGSENKTIAVPKITLTKPGEPAPVTNTQ
ncbi:hypothetical protein [uncultured Sphingomonas sp.]|uniref:hypothetical protein n=1 Tax=uncultured Sphingomonas sp. TaxID=158754 RepID=UPI0035CA1C81